MELKTKEVKSYKYMLVAVVAFTGWILETWYFGWHTTAQSPAEHIADFGIAVLLFWSIIGDIVSNVQVHKHYNITTQDVTITLDPVDEK